MIEISAAGTEREIVDEIDDEPVSQVIVGASPLFMQIERIARDVAVSSRGNQGIGRVVDRMRPGVSGLEVQSVAKSFMKYGLQSVVGSVANRFEQDRLFKRGIPSYLR